MSTKTFLPLLVRSRVPATARLEKDRARQEINKKKSFMALSVQPIYV